MYRLLFILFLLLSFSNIANAAWLDDLSSTVAFLSNKDKNKIDIGTGFFIYEDKNLFLVTADHVSKLLSNKSDITVRTDGDKPFSFKFSDIITITKPEKELPWIRHDKADIAILPLSNDLVSKLSVLNNHFLSVSYVYGGKDSVARDITLTVLGFPLALGVGEYFSPISRETKPASGFLVLKRSDTKQPSTFFITQDPSIGGYSGAPVFDLRMPRYIQGKGVVLKHHKDKPRVVGIVHGTIPDKTGGKLGVVTPSFYLKELVDSYTSN
jgi:hypothetical protein